MAELTQRERLQPSLLDRLTDDDPRQKAESRDKRVLSLEQLRASVLRDVGWLLNTDNYESVADLSAFPLAARSTINYGLPVLSGSTDSGLDLDELQRRMREAIQYFEPRILPDSVQVRAFYFGHEYSQRTLRIHIEGTMWAQPLPLRLFVDTEIDLETGRAQIHT